MVQDILQAGGGDEADVSGAWRGPASFWLEFLALLVQVDFLLPKVEGPPPALKNEKKKKMVLTSSGSL